MMTPSLSSSPPLSIEDCRQAGDDFGQGMRGRSRQKFEAALMHQLDMLVAALAETALNEDEAVAAFDVAAWDAWEAVLVGTPAGAQESEGGRGQSRGRPKV